MPYDTQDMEYIAEYGLSGNERNMVPYSLVIWKSTYKDENWTNWELRLKGAWAREGHLWDFEFEKEQSGMEETSEVWFFQTQEKRMSEKKGVVKH